MISDMDAKSSPDDNDIGDVFVEAFNTAPSLSAQLLDTGMDTAVSSPEQTTNDTPASTTGGTGGPKLNPRSCVTCRRRKVRCDKREPCSNCVKANNECVFPPPGRAPRKPRRPHDAELLKRLRRLESVVDSLGTQVDEDGNVHPSIEGNEYPRRSISETLDLNSQGPLRKDSLDHKLGRLLIKDGRSRYVSNEFWSSIGEELADIRQNVDSPSSEEDEDIASPDSANDTSGRYGLHQEWIFGYSSVMYDMSKLHPSPSQIFIIWEIFKENVDPVLKIVHAPTVKNIIMKAAVGASSLSKASEALFYSICFSAIVSMTDDQCKQLLGYDKAPLMQRYRFAVEQGLARAGFLNSSNLVVLQAFVLFLTCVKYIDTSRSVWALSGLAMQHAQAQGLHRDGTNFNLLPFEIEMRRRLWHHISLLDARATEEHGADPSFQDHFFDTKLPLNVNDEDLWPEMTETPREQPGASDMTFVLVRFELGHMQRRLRISASSQTEEDQEHLVGQQEKLIDRTHQQMQEKYFVHCDPTSPILWVASTVGKLILAKMWLFIHHPRVSQQQHNDVDNANDLKDQVFMTTVEVIEFGALLARSKNTMKWSWLFQTYLQWHAVVYVLSELCTRPPGHDFERAWNALDSLYDHHMIEHTKGHRGALWRPLKQLYARAKKRRAELTSKSPPSSNGNTSIPSDSPAQNMLNEFPQSNNIFTTNPYTSVMPTMTDTFNFDFNDPIFEPMSGGYGNDLNGVDFMVGGQLQDQAAFQPADQLPFGFQRGIDFLDDYGGFPTQPNFGQPMPQEWH